MINTNKNKRWTVYVGAIEVNDYFMSKEEAMALALEYAIADYDDVYIINVDTDEEVNL